MSERARPSIRLTATRIGRTDLGDGSAVVDDDAIIVSVRASADQRPIRLPLASVDAVSVSGDELHLSLRDGTRMVLVSAYAEHLCDDVLVRCRAMPEVTSALRAFGSRRGQRSTRDASASDQQRFFGPLLEARRQAGAAGGPLAVMAAFEASAIAEALSSALASFAVERHGETGPARRALEAELVDVAEPLSLALAAMGKAALEAGVEIDNLRLWRAWAGQVRATFETADRVWLEIDAVLDTSSPTI